MPYLRKLPSKRWQATVKVDGRRYTATRNTREAARTWAAQLEDDLRNGYSPTVAAAPVTVGEWLDRWMEARVAEPTTLATNRGRLSKHVRPTWKDVHLGDVRTLAVQSWVRRMERDGVGPATIHASFVLLSAALGAAVVEGLLPANPCDRVKLPTVPRGRETFYTREQVDAIVAEVEERYRAPVLFLAYTGLRWGEAIGLHLAHLHTLARRVDVRQTITEVDGKFAPKAYPKQNASWRTVPIPEPVRDRIAAHLATTGAGRDDLVFVNRLGRPLDDCHFRQRNWARAVEAAGLEELRPRIHDLRHTAASWLVQRGVPLYDVQHFLGHESIVTTQRYSHLAPDRHDRIRDAFAEPGAPRAHGL